MPIPPGYILRHPVDADLPAAQAVLDAVEAHDTGKLRRHERRPATDWEDPRSDPGSDWWVIVAPGGMVAGFAWVWPQTGGEVTADHYVHPVCRGIGIGDVLLDAIEARVAELPPRRSDGAVRSLIVSCGDSDVVRWALAASALSASGTRWRWICAMNRVMYRGRQG